MKKINNKWVITFSVLLILLVFAIVKYFVTPRTVLEFQSEDGEITVRITEKRSLFQAGPKHEYDYGLVVTKKRFPFDKVLCDEDFVFKIDGAGIDESCVNLEWSSWRVHIVIDSPEMDPYRLSVNFMDDGSDLEVEKVHTFDNLIWLCSGQAFLDLNEEEQKAILDKAISNVQETFQFESYDYNIKQKPLVLTVYYPSGDVHAYQLQPSNPEENK